MIFQRRLIRLILDSYFIQEVQKAKMDKTLKDLTKHISKEDLDKIFKGTYNSDKNAMEESINYPSVK